MFKLYTNKIQNQYHIHETNDTLLKLSLPLTTGVWFGFLWSERAVFLGSGPSFTYPTRTIFHDLKPLFMEDVAIWPCLGILHNWHIKLPSASFLISHLQFKKYYLKITNININSGSGTIWWFSVRKQSSCAQSIHTCFRWSSSRTYGIK